MKKIKDGIVDVTKYNKAKYKILWILKEGNVDNNDKDKERDICEEFRTDWHKANALAIPTFRKIIYATYGILHPETTWHDTPYADKEAYEVIKEIAYININKYPGDSGSDWKIIKEAYSQNKEEILGQIQSFYPNIIICGGTGGYIPWVDLDPIGWGNSTFDAVPVEKEAKVFTNYYLISRTRLLICTSHPAYTHLSNERYWYDIKEAVSSWEKKFQK